MFTMAGNGTTLTLGQIKVITYVYIGFLTPSVIGSFSVIVVSLLRWRNLQEQRHLLVQLALADLLASVVLMSITVTNVVSKGYNAKLCLFGLPLSLAFYVLSFMLVNSYALKSKNIFRGWRMRPADFEDVQSVRTRETIGYVLLWVIPIVIYLIYALSILPHSNSLVPLKIEPPCCQTCILFSHVPMDNCSNYDFKHQEPMYILLFFMGVAVILFCTAIYCEISKWYQGQQQQALFPVEGDGQSRRRFKHVVPTARRMILVIIFCWSPALLLFVLTLSIKQSSLYPLYIIQAATVSLQGFLNSMVYAWRRPNFTEAVLGERTPLITYNHMSFFEESLKIAV